METWHIFDQEISEGTKRPTGGHGDRAHLWSGNKWGTKRLVDMETGHIFDQEISEGTKRLVDMETGHIFDQEISEGT